MGPVCCIEVRREGGPPVLDMCGEAVGSRAGMLRCIQACDRSCFFFSASGDGDQNDDDCEDVVRFTACLAITREDLARVQRSTADVSRCKLSCSCV
jgi:hypothetical protein